MGTLEWENFICLYSSPVSQSVLKRIAAASGSNIKPFLQVQCNNCWKLLGNKFQCIVQTIFLYDDKSIPSSYLNKQHEQSN